MNLSVMFFMLTLLILTLPIASSLITKPYTNMLSNHIKMSIHYAFITSLVPALMFFHSNQEIMISNWHWLTIHTMKLSLSFKMDHFSLLFVPVALFVTWSIIEFSMWYMHSDPNLERFLKYLLLFLITMMILVTANNLFQLFIGWEGVGIMSFLLIGWWHGRTDANTAALQAVLYNRIGDIGFVMAMAWLLIYTNSWEFQQIFLACPHNNTLPMLGLLLAATGKSAQFGLHPWLPAAMEGPTPVSALLHSSTMVVAGVFLLIRFYPMMENNPKIQTFTLCLGAITTVFTAMCALTQNDIKKIIAFSTSSQLGLMIVTIGLNQPHLAFLHICTHAFFKAMLFLCSGSIIHSLNDEQDIRKMGGLYKTLPFTTSALIIGSLALTGMPFLTGFYSKDLIIETANLSNANAWAIIMTLLATSMTAMYSTRIIFFVLMGQPRYQPLIIINENNPLLTKPIKRLIIGSIFAGYFISKLMIPTSTSQLTMPLYIKMTALIITILGFALALELNLLTHNFKFKTPYPYYNFSNSLGYFPTTIHRLPTSLSLITGLNLASISMDQAWLEKALPKSISTINKSASTSSSHQKGLLKLYFLSFMISLLTGLTLLI
uniref:NADH dehydrogenase subunit 5 n=1 Tax=Rhynchocyon stuhlmanni TaxID=3036954 RepID=UPI0024347EE3|nr:NADH dehydrogenase subunit 5 [Rhynchocyon stuhlmanni]WEW63482.1 NADH dehydrogenase subunit 5 [Rhynchocyon stuhlmanni]